MRANRFPEHLFLVGCGNMAGPMLARWLECGLDPARVTVYRPSGKSVADGVAVLDAWPEYLPRSEEHTSELQSLMRSSYAVFCLKKKRIILNRQKVHIMLQ